METDKYNVNRERSLDDSDRRLSEQLSAQQPSPSEAAIAEDDNPTRVTMYDEIAGIFHDDPPTILLGQPLGRRFFTKYISGFYFNPMLPGDAGPLWDMSKSAS